MVVSLDNNGEDKNLSPYAFTKSKNLEILANLQNGLILSMVIFFIMYMVLVKLVKEICQQLLGFLKTII